MFIIDDLLIAAGIAALSGTANAISDSAAASQQQENIGAYIKEISKNRIDNEGLDKLLLANKRLFNNKLVSTLNTAALKTNNIANSNVVAGSLASNISAAAVESEIDIRYKVQENNRSVGGQIAAAKLGMPATDPVGSFFTGAIPGFTAGLEAIKYGNNLGGSTNTASPRAQAPVTPSQGTVPGFLPTPTPIGSNTNVSGYSLQPGYFNNQDRTGVLDFNYNPFEPSNNKFFNSLRDQFNTQNLGGI